MDRIVAIQKSLTVFVCGVCGFIPVIGLIPAVYARRNWLAVRSRYGSHWNPAAGYLNGGAVLALAGVLGSFLVCLVVALIIAA